MIWARVSSWSFSFFFFFFFPDGIELLLYWLQRIWSVWFQYWPSGEVHVSSRLLCCWERVFAMTSAFSWQYSFSLFPASFCTPRPNLPVTQSVSWLPTFAFQSPIMKRTSFWVLVLEGLVGLHRTIQLQLLQHYCWGMDLDYFDTKWFTLETNRDHSLIFEIASKYCISNSCWLWWLLHFF